MSIERAEQLKRELTDRWVIVDPQVAELKRFAQRTGRVRTVNMNCRALVEFDGPADIGWYDIDPAFLTIVAAPQPITTSSGPTPKSTVAEQPRPAATTPDPASSRSVPEASASGRPLSPIELIRQQQAAKQAAANTSTSAPIAGLSPTSAESLPSPDEPGISPVERIRRQAALKKAQASIPEAVPPTTPVQTGGPSGPSADLPAGPPRP